MGSLQFGEFPPFRGVIGQLIVGQRDPGNNIRAHTKSYPVAGTATGTATITVSNQNGTFQSGTIPIANVSPGLYALNAGGLAAAYAVSVSSGTAQLLPVFQVSGGSVVPLPLSVGPNIQVTLEVFGTAIRNAKTVTATVGGLSVPVPYVGTTVDAGLDQVNIAPLPSSLAGQGSVTIVLSADGQEANTVNVTVQ